MSAKGWYEQQLEREIASLETLQKEMTRKGDDHAKRSRQDFADAMHALASAVSDAAAKLREWRGALDESTEAEA